MSKHTPGPWQVEIDPWHFDTASTVVGGKKVKAKGIGQQMLVQVGGWASPTEQEANARLIAAAPELLEAAARARDIAMEYTAKARIPECGKFSQIAQELDAAIAKATGELQP